MRRKRLGILLVAFLIHPAFLGGQVGPSNPPGGSQSETQCRKRVLVFLDVSGSMRPKVRGSGSPFWQSLDALQGLLNEPGFIEDSDVLEVIRFGKRVNVKNRATGRGEIRALLQVLKANDLQDVDTDFRLFFEELSKAMEESTFYDSQVILLGSDLVHEKFNGAPTEQDLEDWAVAQDEKAEELAKIKENSANAASVLFIPQVRSSDLLIQQRVLQNIRENEYLPRIKEIEAGGSSRTLAEELINGLILAPHLTISRDKDDPKYLRFIVTNPNCQELRLTDVSVQVGKGSQARTMPFPLEPDEAILGATGTPEGTRAIRRQLPTGPGWEDLSSLTATVKTERGQVGSTSGTAGSWLRYKPVRGVVEGYLVTGPVLRLDLSVLGHTAEVEKTYDLVLRADEQSSDAPPLASRKFSSPVELDAQEATTMRIVLPISRDFYDLLDRNATFRVSVTGAGAELLEEGNDTVTILRDPVADRSNLYLAIAGLIGGVVVIFCWLRVRELVRQFPALRSARKQLPWWIGMLSAALMPLFFNLIHVWLLRFLTPLKADWLAICLSFVFLVIALIWSVRKWKLASFSKKVLTGNPPLEYKDYRKQSVWGARVPWTVGLGVPLLLTMTWFFSRPPVSANLARDTAPPQLRVVSE